MKHFYLVSSIYQIIIGILKKSPLPSTIYSWQRYIQRLFKDKTQIDSVTYMLRKKNFTVSVTYHNG